MTTRTKHRVIGLLVLCAVLAIFLPVLFHHSGPSADLQLSMQAPNLPAEPNVELQLPTAPTESSTKAIPVAAQTHTLSIAANGQKPKNAPVVEATPSNNTDEAASSKSKSITIDQAFKQAESAKPTSESAPQKTMSTATFVKQSSTTTVKSTPGVAPQQSQSVSTTTKTTAPDNTTKPADQSAALAPTVADNHAWVIQLGSFSDSANAGHLISALRQKGYDAYLQQGPINGGKSVINRVFVGPEMRFDKAKALQKRLLSEFKLTGQIHPYKATT